MARIKFGSIVTEGSGSLGGHTIQNSKGGIQIRNKPIPRNAPSTLQFKIRRINSKLHGTWRSLSDAQRHIWEVYANPVMSGHNMYFKMNYYRAFDDLPLYLTPYVIESGYGPELVTGGDFSNPSDWSIYASTWSIASGYAQYLDTAFGYIYQPLTLTSGVSYNLRFKITEVTGVARIRFAGQPTPSIFEPPYDFYQSLPGDDYNVNLLCTASCTYLRVEAGTAGGIFNLDDLSIREVL